jgi:3-deoxy-D-manno-octulosonate 8-phosphate phosphatase (KDO 8-P phosphatase)
LETRTKPFSSYKSIGELFQNIQFSSENFPTFVRAFRKYKYMGSINYDLKKIKGFIFDVDGVLSPDSIPLHPSGEPMRVINTKDGYAMQLAAKQGYQLAIITGGDTQSVRKRFESLGFQRVYLKAKHKIDEFKDFLARTGLDPEEICYVGDDIPDYEVMQLVGLPVCPADAAPEIKNISKYISPKEGGKGVGRDVIEQVLKAQNKWMKSDAFGW